MSGTDERAEAMSGEPAHQMACMEIWGGTAASDRTVSTPGLTAHVFGQPYAGDAAGGDVHYVSMCGAGNISRFLVADVSGHGARVADVAQRLRRLMRRHINRVDASGLVRALNDEFGALDDGTHFATALVMTYFAPTDQVVIVNAGHPRPLWYRAAKRQWTLLTHDIPDRDENAPRNLPLGVIPGTKYAQFAVRLERDDLLLLFTDALIEASNASNQLLGETGLLETAQRLNVQQQERVGAALLNELEAYRGHKPAADDLTIIAVHHNAADPPKLSFGERLHTMAKMCGLARV